MTNEVMAELLDRVPELCERPGCPRAAETWCPLCEKFLCVLHDELVPRRMHACLGEPADEDAP
jgi:hypothetical protein